MPKEDLPILNMGNPLHKRLLLDWVKGLHGVYRVEFTKVRNQRSLSQNAYYWGVVLPCVGRALTEQWGERFGVIRAHDLMKSMFATEPAVDRRTGEVRATLTRSTADLDVAEFAAYLDAVIGFARDELGTNVPAPGEYASGPEDEWAEAEA
jgi:hypothetical protein